MRLFILSRPDMGADVTKHFCKIDFFFPTNQICYSRIIEEEIDIRKVLSFCDFISQSELDYIDNSAREYVTKWKTRKNLRERANLNSVFYRFREVEYFKLILRNILAKFAINEILFFATLEEPLSTALIELDGNFKLTNLCGADQSPFMPYRRLNIPNNQNKISHFDLIFIATAVPNIENNIAKYSSRFRKVLVVMDFCFSGDCHAIMRHFANSSNITFELLSTENGRFYELGENVNYIKEVDLYLGHLIEEFDCPVLISDNVHIENSLALFHAKANSRKVYVVPHSIRPIDEIVCFDFQDLADCEYKYLSPKSQNGLGVTLDGNYFNIAIKVLVLIFRVIKRLLSDDREKYIGIVVTTDQLYNYIRHNILDLCDEILNLNNAFNGKHKIVVRLRSNEDRSTVWRKLNTKVHNISFQNSNQVSLDQFIDGSFLISEVGNNSSVGYQSIQLLKPYFSKKSNRRVDISSARFDDVYMPIDCIKNLIYSKSPTQMKYRSLYVAVSQFLKMCFLML